MKDLDDVISEIEDVVYRVKYHGDVLKVETLEQWIKDLKQVEEVLDGER